MCHLTVHSNFEPDGVVHMIQKGTDILNTPYDRIVARDHDDEEDVALMQCSIELHFEEDK
jgi:hypothetical protein